LAQGSQRRRLSPLQQDTGGVCARAVPQPGMGQVAEELQCGSLEQG